MLSDNKRPTQGREKFFGLAASKNGNSAEPQGCRFFLLTRQGVGIDSRHADLSIVFQCIRYPLR